MDPHQQLVVVTGFTLLLLLYFVVISRKKKTVEKKEAPEPGGAWPIIGHFRQLGDADQLLHRTLGVMADKHGAIFSLRLGCLRFLVVSSKEAAKECYTTHDKAFASRPTTTAGKHMCYNQAVFAFGPYSSYWREMRKIVTHEFLSTGRPLEMLKLVQASEVDVLTRRLYDLWVENNHVPAIVDLKQKFEDLSLAVIVRMVAGKRFVDPYNDVEAKRCHKVISEFFHLMGASVVSDAFPFLRWLDLQGHEQAMKKTAKEFDAIFEGWLDEHRRSRVSREAKAAETQEDFIDFMLSLEETGHFFDFPYDADTVIKSTCLALVFGASDTTATALTWALSLLLNNPQALKKAQEELDGQVGNGRLVEQSDIKNLVYLQAIVKETLRLHPPAALSGPREATEDCTVAGYRVQKGTRLIVNVWKIHRDPLNWSDPLDFEPERFLTSNADVDVRGQHFELLPFGSGRRSCPGTSFALQALHLTLGRLLHSFNLTTSMDHPIDMTETPGLNVPKATPLQILLSPRLPTELYI